MVAQEMAHSAQTQDEKVMEAAVRMVEQGLCGLQIGFRRRVLERLLAEITPEDERAEAEREDRITAILTGERPQDLVEPESSERRLVLNKAQGPFVPLVRWLLGRSPMEKFVAVAANTLLNGDVEANVRDNGFYEGSIGNELFRTWEADVEGIVPDELPPDTREAFAFIMGMRATKP